MSHYEESVESGQAIQNARYGVSQLQDGLGLLGLETAVIAIALGWYFHMWSVGILSYAGMLVALVFSQRARKVWALLFSICVGLFCLAIGLTIGQFADGSMLLGWVIGILFGVLGFTASMAKHGWGFLALMQEADRGAGEQQAGIQ